MHVWKCGRFNLPLGRKTYVMGILNATPDSFSGDGTGADLEAALRRAQQMIEGGADILDIGGESTRPRRGTRFCPRRSAPRCSPGARARCTTQCPNFR
jgi:dihydropteroate synthase